ncbi:MAG: TIGR01777 family oxidoreductase [Luteolibacter sp.]
MPHHPVIAISGVTGFIGSGLPALLKARGASLLGISRAGSGNFPEIDDWQKPDALDLRRVDAIVNLAGERIDRRWTRKNRRRFFESRVTHTRRLVSHLASLPVDVRPRVLIQGSATGYYGDGGDTLLPETAPPGTGYLAELCRDWENAASEAKTLGLRVVTLRTGIVIGRGGPAFEKLTTVFRLGLGGKLGSGRQWMPWIHLEDLRRAIVHAVFTDALEGPVNGTAPTPERNIDFTRKLAAALHRPALFTVPPVALKLALGKFASALLGGQHAPPLALERSGFHFQHPTLEAALENLLA